MAVLKVIEVVGISPVGWQEAAEVALATASRTLRCIEHLEVVRQTATVAGNRIVEYHTTVRLHFRVEEQREEDEAVAAAEAILNEESSLPTGPASYSPSLPATR